MSNLVLVESPAKAKTIEKYLGKGYKVQATVGHIIDLPSNKLAVDIEHKYEPEFDVMKGKSKIITSLKKAVKANKDGDVYLAMDPDREGEAIAHHVVSALNLKSQHTYRVTFHEITKSAIQEAMKKPGDIDDNLVQAQFARRVLDRLVGYKVSGVLWKKMWYGLSAGRVQSVALRLIVERERLRKAFKPEEYWDVDGLFLVHSKFIGKDATGKKSKEPENLEECSAKKARLDKQNGKNFLPASKKEIDDLRKAVEGQDAVVSEVKEKKVKSSPYPPFTTSTLQQAGNNLFGFSAKKTMAVAQILYQAGYITYMRTDSVNLSKKAISGARKVIKEKFSEKYLPKEPNYYKRKSKLAQEAHEAIRPTDFGRSVAFVKKNIGKDAGRLYDIIWKNTLASQMVSQQLERLHVVLSVNGRDKRKYTFKMTGQKVLFDGFRKIWEGKNGAKQDTTQELSNLSKGDKYKLDKLEVEQKWTKPKARYTEASLVKQLENHGVGRPSTYASIISTIMNRGYVKKDGRSLFPTDVGEVVCGFLEHYFKRLVDYEYTAKVEEDLDKIATGDVEYFPFVDSQYKPLVKEIDEVMEGVDKSDVVVLGKSDEKCPDCGGEMVVKIGKYGKFLSCAKFPKCKGIKSLDGEDSENVLSVEGLNKEKYQIPKKCPECGAKLKLKMGRYGKFWACEKYPKCKGTVPMLLKEKCPKCGEALVERKGRWGKMFTGCSGYPKCKYIKKKTPKAKKIEKKKVKKKNGVKKQKGAKKKSRKKVSTKKLSSRSK